MHNILAIGIFAICVAFVFSLPQKESVDKTSSISPLEVTTVKKPDEKRVVRNAHHFGHFGHGFPRYHHHHYGSSSSESHEHYRHGYGYYG